uniref:FAD:protein FMN transferase n=1 Tax=uncultured Draconibacterium sp. TaxID=1573823 RepID=UPI003217564F
MPESTIFSDTFLAMGAPCDVVLPEVESTFAKEIFQKIKTEIEQLENNISRFSTLSAIWKVNNTPKDEWIPVSLETWEILKICKDFFEMSNGAFDITTAPLSSLWTENETPTIEEIENAKEKCGFDKIELDEDNKSIRFTADDMELDFSAIEKGFALDILKPMLIDMGVKNAIISFQEEAVLALGNHPGGDVWPLGIRNQKKPMEFNHVFPTSNQSVVTAGTVFIRDDGEGIQKRQIISPATGTLIEGDKTVSVKSESATMGAFISTIWLILPENDKEILAGNFENIEIMEVDYLEDDIRTKLSIF